MNLRVNVKSPGNCSDKEIEVFESFVNKGDEVDVMGLKERIMAAHKLIFVLNDECLGVGAIKKPNNGYKAKVFKKAGIQILADEFLYELGWIYVLENTRGLGIGSIIMKSISREINENKCYATTRENNDGMRYLLEKHAYSLNGDKYLGRNKKNNLVLYTSTS